FRAAPFAALLVKLAREEKPEVVLAGATTRGRDALGTAAVDLEASAFADVTELSVAGSDLVATRPVYAGKLMAEVVGNRKPLLISLRPRAFPQPEPDSARTGNV